MSREFKYRPDIDGLRAIAVLSVFIYHLRAAWLPWGFVGVDIFFVISGYLITTILVTELQSGTFTFLGFYERRVRRIFPALLVTLAVTLLFGLLILLPRDLSDLAGSTAASALSVSNFYFLTTGGYFSGPAEFKPLLHTWSLGVEEQFYIVVPIALMVLIRWLPKYALAIWSVGLLLSFLLAVAIVELHMFGLSSKTAFFMMPTRAWELMAGGILAFTPELRRRAERHADVFGLAGLALLIATPFGFTFRDSFPGLGAVQPTLGSCLVILAGQNPRAISRRILSLRPLVWTGLISYSLYLIHWPVISFTRYVTQEPLSLISALVILVGATLTAAVSYYFVEKPFQKRPASSVGLDTSMGARTVWMIAGPSTAVIAACALLIDFTGGLKSRFGDLESQFVTAPANDASPVVCKAALEERSEYCSALAGGSSMGMVGVLGDSHAGALKHTLARAAGKHKLDTRISVMTGCPPVIGINIGGQTPNCSKGRGQGFASLYKIPDLHAVVLISRWALFVEQDGFDISGKFPIKAPSDGGTKGDWLSVMFPEPRPSIDEGANMIEDALVEALHEIPMGVPVILLLPLPEMESYVFTSAQIRLRFNAPIAISVEREAYIRRVARTRELIQSAALRSGREVIVVDPIEALCDDKNCWGARGRQSFYNDDDHVSQLGAHLLLPVLTKALDEALNKKGPARNADK